MNKWDGEGTLFAIQVFCDPRSHNETLYSQAAGVLIFPLLFVHRVTSLEIVTSHTLKLCYQFRFTNLILSSILLQVTIYCFLGFSCHFGSQCVLAFLPYLNLSEFISSIPAYHFINFTQCSHYGCVEMFHSSRPLVIIVLIC